MKKEVQSISELERVVELQVTSREVSQLGGGVELERAATNNGLELETGILKREVVSNMQECGYETDILVYCVNNYHASD